MLRYRSFQTLRYLRARTPNETDLSSFEGFSKFQQKHKVSDSHAGQLPTADIGHRVWYDYGWLKRLKYAAGEYPSIFFSVLLGSLGVSLLFFAPTVKKWLGTEHNTPIPRNYPVPKTPRKQLQGYDD